MRCPDCNKFVSNGEPEAELQSGEDFEAEIDEGKLFIKSEAEIRLMIPCGDCGAELKDTTFTLEMEGEHECKSFPKEKPENIEVTGNIEVEATDRYQDKDRHGKLIKKMRYQAHLYGVEATATVECPFCKEEITFSNNDEIESSAMDELV